MSNDYNQAAQPNPGGPISFSDLFMHLFDNNMMPPPIPFPVGLNAPPFPHLLPNPNNLMQQQLDELNNARNALEAQNRQLSAEKRQLEKDLLAQKSTNETMAPNLASAIQENQKLERVLREKETELGAAELLAAQNGGDRADIYEAYRRVQNQVNEKNRLISGLQNYNLRLARQKQALEREAMYYRDEIEEKDQELYDKSKLVDELQSQNEQKDQKIRKLEERMAKFEQLCAPLELLVQEINNRDGSGPSTSSATGPTTRSRSRKRAAPSTAAQVMGRPRRTTRKD